MNKRNIFPPMKTKGLHSFLNTAVVMKIGVFYAALPKKQISGIDVSRAPRTFAGKRKCFQSEQSMDKPKANCAYRQTSAGPYALVVMGKLSCSKFYQLRSYGRQTEIAQFPREKIGSFSRIPI
ncbi:MAG: hypothetical protein R3C14_06345 [Caldilineaceae bacterium]